MRTARAQAWRWLVAVFVWSAIMSVSPVPVAGMIGDDTFSIGERDQFSALWSFEYAVGGTLDMTITLDSWQTDSTNTSIQFLFCTDSQIANLREATITQVCSTPIFDYTACNLVMKLGEPPASQTSVRFSWTAETEDWYRVLELNCGGWEWTVDLNYVAVNPGGEYLSLSDVPYKPLYVAACIGWSVLLAVWCYNWFRYRYFNIRLQRVMTLVPLSKLLFSILLLYYWRECSKTGYSPQGLFWSSFVFVTLARGLFFSELMLIGKGWSITRYELHDWGRLITLAIFLLIAHALYSYYSGFVLFLLVIMYVIVLRFIFASIAENSQALMQQLELIRRLDRIDHRTTPVWTKLQMYKRFQVAMVVFVSIDVIFHLWATIFLRETPWVEDMMEHVLTGVMAIGVGYTFRLQPFNPYFYRVGHAGAQPLPPPVGGAPNGSGRSSNTTAASAGGGTVASPPSSGADAMLLAIHAAATGSSGTATAATAGGAAAAHTESATQPLIAGDSSSSSDSAHPISGRSGGGSAAAAAEPRVSGLMIWQPGMPLPALPAANAWSIAGGDDSMSENGTGSASSSYAPPPIVIVQNPGNDVALASRSTYEPPAVIPRLQYHPLSPTQRPSQQSLRSPLSPLSASSGGGTFVMMPTAELPPLPLSLPPPATATASATASTSTIALLDIKSSR